MDSFNPKERGKAQGRTMRRGGSAERRIYRLSAESRYAVQLLALFHVS
jgi:hypothetical protein